MTDKKVEFRPYADDRQHLAHIQHQLGITKSDAIRRSLAVMAEMLRLYDTPDDALAILASLPQRATTNQIVAMISTLVAKLAQRGLPSPSTPASIHVSDTHWQSIVRSQTVDSRMSEIYPFILHAEATNKYVFGIESDESVDRDQPFYVFRRVGDTWTGTLFLGETTDTSDRHMIRDELDHAVHQWLNSADS